MLPPDIAALLEQHGVQAATRAALTDLYIAIGSLAVDALADYCDDRDPASVAPQEIENVRRFAIEKFVRANHPLWMNGRPTRSLWQPRGLEGRAAGMLSPIGCIGLEPRTAISSRIEETARRIIGDGQPLPRGVIMMGRTAHYGGRLDTISFDILFDDPERAVDVALAEGQQHTMPGSVGETSGSFSARGPMALLWEIQPNVYKPQGDRNRQIGASYRRHRNWHVTTLAAAMLWLMEQGAAIYVLTGEALAVAHEVNPAKPVSGDIAVFHDRAVERVAAALDLRSATPTDDEVALLLETELPNVALSKELRRRGAAGLISRLVPA